MNIQTDPHRSKKNPPKKTSKAKNEERRKKKTRHSHSHPTTTVTESPSSIIIRIDQKPHPLVYPSSSPYMDLNPSTLKPNSQARAFTPFSPPSQLQETNTVNATVNEAISLSASNQQIPTLSSLSHLKRCRRCHCHHHHGHHSDDDDGDDFRIR